jgi:aminopeptidase N
MAEILEFTVAHEVAHQYFAGLVGNDTRLHAAVDEPLAQFAAALCLADRHGEEAAASALARNAKLNYGIYRMLGGRDGVASRPTAAFRSPLEYAALVYGKAPYFYVELRRRLGAARLDAILHQAVARHRFRLVTTGEWIASLAEAAGAQADLVRGLARRWLDQAHGDADLQVDDSGRQVIAEMLGPEMAAQLEQGLTFLGMQPRDLFRMMMGSLAGDNDAPPATGIDPAEALRRLQELQ